MVGGIDERSHEDTHTHTTDLITTVTKLLALSQNWKLITLQCIQDVYRFLRKDLERLSWYLTSINYLFRLLDRGHAGAQPWKVWSNKSNTVQTFKSSYSCSYFCRTGNYGDVNKPRPAVKWHGHNAVMVSDSRTEPETTLLLSEFSKYFHSYETQTPSFGDRFVFKSEPVNDDHYNY